MATGPEHYKAGEEALTAGLVFMPGSANRTAKLDEAKTHFLAALVAATIAQSETPIAMQWHEALI